MEGEGHAAATWEGRRMKWQPYPGYKPSGVEWLGRCRSIGSVFALKNIATFRITVIRIDMPRSHSGEL